MVYHKWRTGTRAGEYTLVQYAELILREIRSRPPDQPIWLQTHAWFGDYRPGWDRHNIIVHHLDATAHDTPGIWPDRGLDIWRGRQERFVNYLRERGARIDGWPLDHETWVHQWAHSFQGPNVFRNIVLDPRWKIRPIIGVGMTGSALLDPERVAGESETFLKRNRVTGDLDPDCRLSHDHVVVPAMIMRNAVMNKAFAEPFQAAYPHAWTSDYNKYRMPIRLDLDEPTGVIGPREVWMKLRELVPDLTEVPGVGTHASPSLYGGVKWRGEHLGYREGDDVVDVMLRHIDDLIDLYGDADNVIPWICPPTFVAQRHFDRARDGERSMDPDQYERLIIGLAERGIRRMILWNGRGTTPDAERELLAALKKAYEIAEARLAQKKDEGNK